MRYRKLMAAYDVLLFLMLMFFVGIIVLAMNGVTPP